MLNAGRGRKSKTIRPREIRKARLNARRCRGHYGEQSASERWADVYQARGNYDEG